MAMLKLQSIYPILRVSKLALCLIAITYNPAIFADKLDIRSEKLIIDRNNNISTFEGRVVVEFKDIILKTHKIEVIYKAENINKNTASSEKIEKIKITNKFTALREIVNQQKTPLSSKEIIKANYAEYLPKEKKLWIKGDVTVIKDDKTINCDELIYYTDIINIHNEEKYNESNN
ncbi:MAG: LptA/(LptD N-terminal domain) transport protein [Rickettsiaceae bacterium]|jgi:lipopolysaccharide transport protein LptA|nr:LptA/(LptD N-terminal domain) transport protein [Rickettsiaceae bacterium]